MELLGGYDSDDEENYTTKEVTIETVLNTKEDMFTRLIKCYINFFNMNR